MRKLLGLLLALWLGGVSSALAQAPVQQCVANAQAGGTPDAITIPLLPCALSTNLLILTTTGANVTTTPTIQMTGFPAQSIVGPTGGPLQIGSIPGPGGVVLLTSTGNEWVLLTSALAGSTGIVEQGAQSQIAFYQTPGTVVTGNSTALVTNGTLTLGASGSTLGSIVLDTTSGGGVTLKVPNTVSGSTTFKFPANSGASANILQTDGAGNTSWVAAPTGTVTGSGLTANDVITGNGGTSIKDSGTALSALAPLASPQLTGTPGLAAATASSLTLFGSSSGQALVQAAPNVGSPTLTVTGNTGTIVTTGDTATVTNQMLADAANLEATAIAVILDGGGSVIPTGNAIDLSIPYACTINSVAMQSLASGSLVVDIYKTALASGPPTSANSITASDKPTITAGVSSQDLTLTGWNKNVSANDWIRFNVNSSNVVTRATLTLKCSKT